MNKNSEKPSCVAVNYGKVKRLTIIPRIIIRASFFPTFKLKPYRIQYQEVNSISVVKVQ